MWTTPSTLRRGFTGESVHTRFPRDAVAPEHINAVLSHNKCGQVFKTWRPLLDLLLGALCNARQFVTCTIKNVHRPVALVLDAQSHRYNPFDDHVVLTTTLRSSSPPTAADKYVIDLTAAQYGWAEMLAPWDQWAAHRTLGSRRAAVEDGGPSAVVGSPPGKLDLMEELCRAVAAAAARAEADGGADVSAVLKLPADGFRAAEARMLDAAREAVHGAAEMLRLREVGARFVGRPWDVRVSRDPRDVALLKEVWLSRGEFEVHRDDAAWVRKTWLERCERVKGRDGFEELGLRGVDYMEGRSLEQGMKEACQRDLARFYWAMRKLLREVGVGV